MLAKRLSEMGVTVFAGVLDVNGEGAQQLRERGCENLQVLQLDVTDASQIEAAQNYICAKVADKGEAERHVDDRRYIHTYTRLILTRCRVLKA